MSYFNNQFKQVFLEELYKCYLEARKNKRRSFDEHKFELGSVAELKSLENDILSGTYQPSRSVAFIIFDPKIREIFAAPFRDRVVHHLIYREVYEWWDKRLINDSYSCRVGKGTLYGINRAQHFMRAIEAKYHEPVFFMKFDLSGYFMSLKRDKLLARALWGLDRQYQGRTDEPMYQILRQLWTAVIMDDPIQGVRLRGKREDWRKLPRRKSLFFQPDGQGIVIGNLTSQMLSNIFLDLLDRYVTHELKFKYYGRYVDDFFIMVPWSEKERLLAAAPQIANFLEKELSLTLNQQKTVSGNAKHGMEFIGAKIYPDHLLPTKRTMKKIRKVFFEFEAGAGHSPESIQSYLGHVQHLNSETMLRKLFSDLGWEYGFTEFEEIIYPKK